jgi:uncharacterized protein YgiM (DUF1202 family)
MKYDCRRIQLVIALVSSVATLAAACAHVATVSQTVAVPAPAPDVDVFEAAIGAAKASGLPAVTKLDKTRGVVEFGAFETPATGYAAQLRQRPDGRLDITVNRATADVPGGVEKKIKQLVAALEARLREASDSAPPPAQSLSEPAVTRPPLFERSRQEPAPATRSDAALTRVVSAPQANLREAGTATAKVVRVLPKNTRLTVFGKADQWYLVQLDDGTGGWVAESVTSPAW